MKPLKTLPELNWARDEIARELSLPVPRVRTTFIGVITAQMLPDSVALKGGLAIKMKLGELGTRATSDLDAVFTDSYSATIEAIENRCSEGWGSVPPSKKQRKANPNAPERVAFTGTIKEKVQYDPGVRHPEYLMRPLRVTLNFLGKPWGAIDLELAHPETITKLNPPSQIDSELTGKFENFGFGKLAPVRFLALEVQIAQKLHALTHPASDRAHDLVDLQILWTDEVELEGLRRACETTFRYRQEHAWPPLPLRSMKADEARYKQAVEEVTVHAQLPHIFLELEDARQWLITKIEHLHYGGAA